jgi:hypothetical protein
MYVIIRAIIRHLFAANETRYAAATKLVRATALAAFLTLPSLVLIPATSVYASAIGPDAPIAALQSEVGTACEWVAYWQDDQSGIAACGTEGTSLYAYDPATTVWVPYQGCWFLYADHPATWIDSGTECLYLLSLQRG